MRWLSHPSSARPLFRGASVGGTPSAISRRAFFTPLLALPFLGNCHSFRSWLTKNLRHFLKLLWFIHHKAGDGIDIELIINVSIANKCREKITYFFKLNVKLLE